jgi:hypothetical protein
MDMTAARPARRYQCLWQGRFRSIQVDCEPAQFPLDIPSAEIGIGLVTRMLSRPGFYSLIAEGLSPASTFSTNAGRLPPSTR